MSLVVHVKIQAGPLGSRQYHINFKVMSQRASLTRPRHGTPRTARLSAPPSLASSLLFSSPRLSSPPPSHPSSYIHPRRPSLCSSSTRRQFYAALLTASRIHAAVSSQTCSERAFQQVTVYCICSHPSRYSHVTVTAPQAIDVSSAFQESSFAVAHVARASDLQTAQTSATTRLYLRSWIRDASLASAQLTITTHDEGRSAIDCTSKSLAR